MLPRTIDKMRAQLPRGKLGSYSITTPFGPGIGILLLRGLALNEKDLFQVVQRVRAEEEIADWLRRSVDLSSKARTNEMLWPKDEAVNGAWVPPPVRRID